MKILVVAGEIRYQTRVNNSLALSVAVITLNEEENLPRCLESVRELASEIVVIDSGSTDRTREVAASFGARFETQPWQGYVAQKNMSLKRCTQPWVLCLDADEAVSPELASAIRGALSSKEPRGHGFVMNRLNFYCGQWIRHAWYPGVAPAAGARDSAQWVGGDVHERLEVKGPTGRLRQAICGITHSGGLWTIFRTRSNSRGSRLIPTNETDGLAAGIT